MLFAVFSLTGLGVALGLALGIASRFFAVTGNPLLAEVAALMPGSNCGQCGFPGCSGAAAAIVDGSASPACCPPGGKALAAALAGKLGIELDLSGVVDEGPKIASVIEDICIGCTRCIKDCPTDAILGAPKQMHTVLPDACSGCGNCVDRCPTDAVIMQPKLVTLQDWGWPKPALAA